MDKFERAEKLGIRDNAGKSSELAFYTPEHFYPLLYVLGAVKEDDRVLVFNDSCVLGSMSMTSYLFQS